MTINEFLERHQLTENPFRGEEARSDSVFARMKSGAGPERDSVYIPPASGLVGSLRHADFEKILGDLRRPSPAVVFGEKGSGKTAIRMQISERIARHNDANPGERLLMVSYDDLNAVLDRLHERVGGASAMDSLKKMRLVDHIDAIVGNVVPRLVDGVLEQAVAGEAISIGADVTRSLSRLDLGIRRDLAILQAVYDRGDGAEGRTRRLVSRLRISRAWRGVVVKFLAFVVPLLLAGGAVYERFFAPEEMRADWHWWALGGLGVLWALFVFKKYAIDRLFNLRVARKVRRQIRVNSRRDVSYARSLRQLDDASRSPTALPTTDSDESRYSMLERLLRVLGALGYRGIIVVMDRVDEPTLVSGDPERMRAIVWPLLNNKFLQQEGLGVKLLLPIELRHLLLKESSAFFQEARLDKQSLVERLSWTGSMLYDLCEARLLACRPAAAAAMTLRDLFAEDVTREDVVEALEQMHQPRDAFKLLYRCIMEHCSSVAGQGGTAQIPRLILEISKKQEAERVQGLYRGIRPG